MSDPMDTIRAGFFEECAELMEALEAGLLALQAGTSDSDTVDSIFRSVHSIKGGAGAFEMGELVSFAHDFETLLDGVRSGRVSPSPDLVACLLRAADRLSDLIEISRDGGTFPPRFDELDAHLATLAASASAEEEDSGFAAVALDLGLDMDLDLLAEPSDPEPETMPFGLFSEQDNEETELAGPMPMCWHIDFRPHADLYGSGNEPLFLFRALSVLGRLNVSIDTVNLPSIHDLDPDATCLNWHIELIPSAADLTETEIESIFEFVEDLCDVTLRQGQSNPTNDRISPPVSAAKDAMELSLEKDPSTPSVAVSEPEKISIAPPEPVAPSVPAPMPAAGGTIAATAPPAAAAKTIRVDLDRVDRLVNLVGELVISQSMLAQSINAAGQSGHDGAAGSLDELQQLTRDIQDSVMSIRAQPVKSLFQRMTRIVREAAQATGKDVRLEVVGESTEIDKTVVERLADPLTHMIRNAVDHGLEPPAEREAAGKPRTGVVRLSASQQSDRVVIEVADDGRGINRQRVLNRAIERGLVEPDARLDTQAIDRLLFRPGFSTNEEVSKLSGRGVGMDVVQKAIRDLNGAVSISSEEGAGCAISASLPLTLAILDGMIVRAANQRMVIPLSAIVETQTRTAAKTRNLGPGRDVAALQGTFVPMIDLASGMGFAGSESVRDDDRAVLFVRPGESGAYALQVDAIESQGQVVIKGLADTFGRVPCVSAATILGDGQVALIVDPASLAQSAGLLRMAQQSTPLEIVA